MNITEIKNWNRTWINIANRTGIAFGLWIELEEKLNRDVYKTWIKIVEMGIGQTRIGTA